MGTGFINGNGVFEHQCEDPNCDRVVLYDDEPFCFGHSPDKGSTVRGYSARAKAEMQAEAERALAGMEVESKPTFQEQQTRTIIEFKDTQILRTLALPYTIPNVVEGQPMVFDHPTLHNGLTGKIVHISHVVFFSDKAPITYIDVEVQ